MNTLKKLWYSADAAKRLLIDCGLLKSIWKGTSIDRLGRPIPWLSLPAVEFLRHLDLRGARVFEFGSGNSTLFWENKHANMQIRSYAAVEYDKEYHARMSLENGFYRDNVVGIANKEEYLKYPYLRATEMTDQEQFFCPYDVTIVDGPIQWRAEELRIAVNVTCSEGLILVDDSNWIARDIRRVCENRNMCRIDFAGFSPGVSYTKVTSLLFRNIGWLMGARIDTPPGGMPKFPGMG